jgi:hypothetical protein
MMREKNEKKEIKSTSSLHDDDEREGKEYYYLLVAWYDGKERREGRNHIITSSLHGACEGKEEKMEMNITSSLHVGQKETSWAGRGKVFMRC